MRFSKKILFLILALVVLIGLLALLISVVRTPDSDTLPSATASPTPSATPEAQPADPSPTPSPTPDTSKPITVIDSDALTELVENYLRENNRSGNGIARGDLTPESELCGMNVMYALERMLVYSDNTVAECLLGLYDSAELRALGAQMAGLSEESCPAAYARTNDYSPRLMLGLLLELYRHSEDYPDVIDYMLLASPGRFFRLTLEGQYDVAQKYGSHLPTLNSAAIIYTPHPFLLTVLTASSGGAEVVLGDMAELFAEYTLTLDETFDSLSESEQQRATAQFDAAAVDPSKNPLPIYTAASDEYYAQQTQDYTEAALRESESAAEEPRS